MVGNRVLKIAGAGFFVAEGQVILVGNVLNGFAQIVDRVQGQLKSAPTGAYDDVVAKAVVGSK